MATPWPDKPCPTCGQTITDLLLEMVPDADQATADYRALNARQPGTTPEEWAAHDKGMPGAFRGYRYAEDP